MLSAPRFASGGLSRRHLLHLVPGSLLLGLSGCQSPKNASGPMPQDDFTLRGKPAMVLKRDGYANVQALASAVVCTPSGEVLKHFTPRDATETINVHSAVKPLHTAMLVEVMGNGKNRVKVPQLQSQELAVLSASHAGTDEHRKWVQSALDKAEIDASFMVCGGRYPYDEATRNRLIKQDIPPAQTPKLYDMCSGHHASQGILSRILGEPLGSYADPEGKLQQFYRSQLAKMGLDKATGLVRFDNCNIPTFNMSARGLATAFARLVTDRIYRPVVEAMAQHPVLVDDDVSLDTRLMQITGGKLIAKLGAEGLITVANRDKQEGLILKEWCGNGHSNFRERITIKALQELGWLTQNQADALGQETEFLMENPKHGIQHQFNSPLWDKA